MAKLVDALALGASGRNTLGVQVPLLAPAFTAIAALQRRLVTAGGPAKERQSLERRLPGIAFATPGLFFHSSRGAIADKRAKVFFLAFYLVFSGIICRLQSAEGILHDASTSRIRAHCTAASH